MLTRLFLAINTFFSKNWVLVKCVLIEMNSANASDYPSHCNKQWIYHIFCPDSITTGQKILQTWDMMSNSICNRLEFEYLNLNGMLKLKLKLYINLAIRCMFPDFSRSIWIISTIYLHINSRFFNQFITRIYNVSRAIARGTILSVTIRTSMEKDMGEVIWEIGVTIQEKVRR